MKKTAHIQRIQKENGLRLWKVTLLAVNEAIFRENN